MLRSNLNGDNVLSRREEQVLKLLLYGYLHKEIAECLGLSVSRVHDIKRSIKSKWKVISDIDFFLLALEKGYLHDRIEAIFKRNEYVSSSTFNLGIDYNYISETN
ncbi:MAG: hypothetical protein Crog4KO_06530 [Crocinitomicaceae bacterium]